MSLSYLQKRAQIQQSLLQKRVGQDQNSSKNLNPVIEDEIEEEKENFQPQQMNQRQMYQERSRINNNQNQMAFDQSLMNYQQRLQPIPDSFDIEEDEVTYVIPQEEISEIQNQTLQLFDISSQNQNGGTVFEIKYEAPSIAKQEDSFFQKLIQSSMPNQQNKQNDQIQLGQQQNQDSQNLFAGFSNQNGGTVFELKYEVPNFIEQQKELFLQSLVQNGEQNQQNKQNNEIQFGLKLNEEQQDLFNADSNSKAQTLDLFKKEQFENPAKMFEVNNQAQNNQDNNFINQLFQNRAAPVQQNNNNYLFRQNITNDAYFYNTYTVPTQTVIHQIDLPNFIQNSCGQSIIINQDLFCEEESQLIKQKQLF